MEPVMEVLLIASTRLEIDQSIQDPVITRWMEEGHEGPEDSDTLSEFAGRACYQSFNRPNVATRANDDYLAHILQVGHESVLEHASATFYVTGVSRSLTHELVRHRHLSFSQLSQRYVDESNVDSVLPPDADEYERKMVEQHTDRARLAYQVLVNGALERGLTRKEARQMARAVLPNATETRIVVTGNMRAWRDVIKKRYHVAADAEIREFAKIVLNQLRFVAPNVFQDMPEEPFGSATKE